MDSVAITIGIAWLLAGTLCIALAIPLLRGRVGRNVFYGMRCSQSLQSDDAWFAINAYGAKRMIIWSLPIVAVGIAAFFIPLNANTAAAIVCAFVPLIFILIPVVETWLFARKYASSV